MDVSVINQLADKVGGFNFSFDVNSLANLPHTRANHILYLLRKLQLSRIQQGTHKTKTRGNVSGGGKKPYKQKGTGNARMGSTRTPLRVGGGVVFGPVPRSHAIRLNRKVVKLAYRIALSRLISLDKVLVFSEDFNLLRTSEASKLLSNSIAGVARPKVTLISSYDDMESSNYIAFRNLDSVAICGVNSIPIERLVMSDLVLFTNKAAHILNERVSV